MLFLMGVIFGVGVVVSYIVASLVFLRYPHFLHKKKNIKFVCRHISHRGGAGENLENTMAAFRHAVNLGTDMIELDCQLSRDNQVVVSHDNLLQRVTGQRVKVSDLDYQSLPHLMSLLPLDFLPDHFTVGGPDTQIPLLESVFQEFPGIPINIDCKENNDLLMQKMSNLINAYNRQDLTVWGNRDETINIKLRKLNPDVPILFSMKRVLWNTFYFYTGLLPFLPIQESFYEIPLPADILTLIPRDSPNYWLKKSVLLTADFFLRSKVLFRHFERRGIQVYIWVQNDKKGFKTAFDLGATGVMTDFPTALMEYMQETGMENNSKRERKSPSLSKEGSHDGEQSGSGEEETETLTGGAPVAAGDTDVYNRSPRKTIGSP